MKKLVLFDIDGTLLKVNGISRKSLVLAFANVFDIPANKIFLHDMAGKLDSKIIEECMEILNLTQSEGALQVQEIKNLYIDTFIRLSTPSHIEIMPAVETLLNQLSTYSNVHIGLLTGNFERSGRHKLELVKINDFFSFGAFAEDGKTRNELPLVAVKRATLLFNSDFIGKDVIIIGDTPYDIECARVLNSKSIAVATGNKTIEELKKFSPDVAVKNFHDTNLILEAILS